MSKRVSNKSHGARPGKKLARSKVKFGYWKTLAMQKAALKKSGEDHA